MFKKSLCIAMIGIVALLVTPAVSSAQRRGGGRGWSGGDRGWGGGDRGWGGVYLGTGGYGYGGYGYGGYGYRGYGYGDPYSSGPDYSPSYYYDPQIAPALSGEAYESQPDMARRAYIAVTVPPNAEIWFEGTKTTQTGANRDFVSPPLESGKRFSYDIRARWIDRDGQTIDETRQVKVEAGRRSTLDFVAARTGNPNQTKENLTTDPKQRANPPVTIPKPNSNSNTTPVPKP